MRALADRTTGGLARVPTAVIANHVNALVDSRLLMAALGRYPRILGKSMLFKIAPLWPFVKLGGVVPDACYVYRSRGSTTGP